MSKLFSLAAFALSILVAQAPASEWQTDYGKALEATRSESRPLLIVLDNPKDPASSVSDEQVTESGDQKELLEAYECCRVDVTTEYGQRVAEAFKATKFPFAAIIDKTGSVVLCKKTGKVSEEEWEQTLETYQSGNRVTPIQQTSFYRGKEVSSSVVSPSYCPSCQRKAQLGY